VAVSWCTWYRNPWFALHKKRTQHGQLRSIAVCCGQSKTPIVLRQFAKVQVEELGAHRWLVYCQGDAQFGLQPPSPTPATSHRALVGEVAAALLGCRTIRSCPEYPYSIPTSGRYGMDWASQRAENNEVSGLEITGWTYMREHPDLRGHQPDSAGRHGQEAAWIEHSQSG
jgi:hypothetical protein